MGEQDQFLFPAIKFGQKTSARQPQYDGYTLESIYIPMSDGVRLAVDVVLPRGLVSGQRIPTLIYRTRYWRDAERRKPPEHPDTILNFFTSYGYAVLRVDVRGTGASFGSVLHEWQPQDLKDTYELVSWIIRQDWSNGGVGSYGVSYPGTTAELLAASGHPEVAAIWAAYHELDGYSDIAFPGGVPSNFIQTWSDFTQALDHNQNPRDDPNIIGVKPVDSDQDHSLLRAALQEHKKNHPIADLAKGVIFRDDKMNLINLSFENMLVYSKRSAIESCNVPLDIWGSWMDANTADTVIRHFTTFRNPVRGVISAWSHGGGSLHDPFLPADTPLEISREVQLQEILRGMDQPFHAIDSGLPERILFYYTLGEGKWKSTTQWPLENTKSFVLYLAAGNELCPTVQELGKDSDIYPVDFDATTGQQNRWWTELGGGPIIYADRAEAGDKLLVYEGQPLEEDMEVTGYPVVTLYVASTEADGAFFVYLEDVDENGKVTYVTEGMLRALHRTISDEEPPYRVYGPYHSYKRENAAPLVPGEIAELKFALIPISVLLRKGHRIRIAIAGADKDTFARVPAVGEPVISVLHNSQYPSNIELPVTKRP
jgi:putative CocE/NonD family hydrolase